MNERMGLLERPKLFPLRVIRPYSTLPETTEAGVNGNRL